MKKKPPLKSQAQAMLKALLEGEKVSRLNCHEHSIAPENSSIHSVASELLNARYIPVRSERGKGKVSVYSLSPSARHDYTHNRQAQKESTRRMVFANRAARMLKGLYRWCDRQQAHLDYLSTDHLKFVLEMGKRAQKRLSELMNSIRGEIVNRGPKSPHASNQRPGKGG